MPHVDLPAVGGWMLLAVFAAVVLDALLPFLPGETLVMAAGVAMAHHDGSSLVPAALLAALTLTAGAMLTRRRAEGQPVAAGRRAEGRPVLARRRAGNQSEIGV